MAKLTFRAMKAKKGDAFFLIAKAEDSQIERDSLVLVDGGPGGVFKPILKPYLEDLKDEKGKTPLIDLLMVSHIDDDHINGVLQLTDDLLDAREENRGELCHIRHAWHNSFSDFIATDNANTLQGKGEPSSVDKFYGKMASISQGALEDALGDTPHQDASKLVLASVKQGRRLRLNLRQLSIKLNSYFPDKIIVVPKGMRSRTRNINKTLRMRIIGPHQEELDALREDWKEALKDILKDDEAGVVAAAGKLDKSVANLSSITVIAECQAQISAKKTRMLLTGDARGDKIMKWLERAGEFNRRGDKGVARFDVLKLPHHGSDKNVTQEFFEKVIADHYIVSGDGSYGNPEPEVFDMILTAAKKNNHKNFKIHLTYSIEEMSKKSAFTNGNRHKRLKKIVDDNPRIFKFRGKNSAYMDITI